MGIKAPFWQCDGLLMGRRLLQVPWYSDINRFIFFLGGEDGTVKIWSRSGMLRSCLAQNSEFLAQFVV